MIIIAPMNANILVVDDEQDLLDLLEMSLAAEGYIVRTAATVADALAAIRTKAPDLILLDIMLGDDSGIQLTAKLKNAPETANIPIILLTAKDKDTDMVVGLSVGADDYITKPFSTPVLAARIQAVLRRAKSPRSTDTETLSAGPLKIVPSARQVLVNGKSVNLTGGEYDILYALVQAAGAILSRQQLQQALGETTQDKDARIIVVHIASIRKKLGIARTIIKTVHQRGYQILF